MISRRGMPDGFPGSGSISLRSRFGSRPDPMGDIGADRLMTGGLPVGQPGRTSSGVGKLFHGPDAQSDYLPMQNLAKISPRSSSALTVPTILPSD